VDKIEGRGQNPEKHKNMGGKISSFKIGEAKSIINQNRGGKIPSFKIGGQNPNLIKIGGIKLHLSQ